MRTLILLFVFAATAFPQALSVGVKGGAPVGDAFTIVSNVTSGRSYFQNTKHFTIGPMFDVRLPFGVGVEIDALYKGLEFGYTATRDGVKVNSLTTGRAWEFPLIIKYSAPSPIIRPYLGAGVSFRRLQGLKQFLSRDVPGLVGARTETSQPEELNEKFTKGIVITGGVGVKALLVRVSPEVRYTRWVGRGFRDALDLFGSNQNQLELLIGLTF